MSNSPESGVAARLIDLSHTVEDGMVTYKGLPGPVICDYWSRAQSAANYDDGSTFQIGRIDLVSNSGTYIDAPFHRYADWRDLAHLDLVRLSGVPGVVVRQPFEAGLAIEAAAFAGLDLRGKAVLVHTGWDRHWRSEAYLTDHPFLTRAAAELLVAQNVVLVGIDSHNIDDTRTRSRPVHSILLGADIPICEHLTGLARLPDAGFGFSAVPPPIKGMGTFPVRAHATLNDRAT